MYYYNKHIKYSDTCKIIYKGGNTERTEIKHRYLDITSIESFSFEFY